MIYKYITRKPDKTIPHGYPAMVECAEEDEWATEFILEYKWGGHAQWIVLKDEATRTAVASAIANAKELGRQMALSQVRLAIGLTT